MNNQLLVSSAQILFFQQLQVQFSMIENNKDKDRRCHGGSVPVCAQCKENKEVIVKYRKLVELLNKKIRQLQKKNKSTVKTQQAQQQSHIILEQIIDKDSCINNDQTSFKTLQSAISHLQQSHKTAAIPAPPFTPSQIPKQKLPLAQDEQQQRFQKISIVINGLTEQVMQLKSNLMHIRHCIYAFFKAVDIGDKIFGKNIALSITLALISIFQFSQNQKQEMFNNKKVKHRKKVLTQDKENIFVTIKEI